MASQHVRVVHGIERLPSWSWEGLWNSIPQRCQVYCGSTWRPCEPFWRRWQWLDHIWEKGGGRQRMSIKNTANRGSWLKAVWHCSFQSAHCLSMTLLVETSSPSFKLLPRRKFQRLISSCPLLKATLQPSRLPTYLLKTLYLPYLHSTHWCDMVSCFYWNLNHWTLVCFTIW